MTLRKEDIDFISILKVPGVAFAYFVLFLGMFNFDVYSAILPLKFREFGYENKDMGFIYFA